MVLAVTVMVLFFLAFWERAREMVEGAAYDPSTFTTTSLLVYGVVMGIGFLIGYLITLSIAKTLPQGWIPVKDVRLAPLDIEGSRKDIYLSIDPDKRITFRIETGKDQSTKESLPGKKRIEVLEVQGAQAWLQISRWGLPNAGQRWFGMTWPKGAKYELTVPTASIICTQTAEIGKQSKATA